jgi:hypothetical protein
MSYPSHNIAEVAYREPIPSSCDSFDSAQRRTICSAPALLKLCRKVAPWPLAPLYSFSSQHEASKVCYPLNHVSWPAAYGDVQTAAVGCSVVGRYRVYYCTSGLWRVAVYACVTSTRQKPVQSLMVLLISSRASDHSPVRS